MTDRGLITARVAAAVGIGASCLALFVVDPAVSELFPPCPWRLATGWLCPGCGSARALHALLHGDVRSAFALNPLAVMTLPIALADASGWMFGYPFNWTSTLKPSTVRALLVGLVAFALVRNI